MNNKITEKNENGFLLINKFIYEIKKYCEVAKLILRAV